MSRFVASVCEALPQFSPSEVEAAIPVVKAGRYLPRLTLIEGLREHLTPAEEKGAFGLTIREQDEILALMRQLNNERIRKNRREELAEYERLLFCQRQYRQSIQLHIIRECFSTITVSK